MSMMLEFANPVFLAFALLAPVVVWWWAVRRRPALRYSDVRLFDGLPTGRVRRAKWGGAILRGLAVLALVIGMAGPRTPDLRTRLPAEGIAIIVALDTSGSMGEQDVFWAPGQTPISRLDAAKRAFTLFVAGGDAPDGTHFEPRRSDPIGLVSFAAVTRVECPLTLNHSVLLRVANGLELASPVEAGTNVGDAIAEGVIRLDRGAGDKRKVLILLSDGEHNVSKEGDRNPLTPRQAAQLAANLNVKVYTIDAGGDPPAGAPPEQVEQRQAGRAALAAVANLTGGRTFAATSGPELRDAYREIGELETFRVEAFLYRRYHEYYPWCAAAAAALLLTAYLLDRTRWRVIP